MKFENIFSKLLDKVLEGQNIDTEGKKKIKNQLFIEKEQALKTPPKIALIGTSGVGKSSTINSLFGTNLSVSHFQACTSVEEEIIITGKNGDIAIYDMPGLGEDIDEDEKHIETYARVLPTCDVVLWIMVANGAGRAMAFDQIVLRDVINRISPKILDRLVIGLNQADLMEPMDWINNANIPSKEQKENLEYRVTDVRKKLGKVVPNLSTERIIYYSAKKRFRLVQLFQALMYACPDDRAWVLESRRSIADYTELIDPEILKLINRKNK
jgi:uncharacterized protein